MKNLKILTLWLLALSSIIAAANVPAPAELEKIKKCSKMSSLEKVRNVARFAYDFFKENSLKTEKEQNEALRQISGQRSTLWAEDLPLFKPHLMGLVLRPYFSSVVCKSRDLNTVKKLIRKDLLNESEKSVIKQQEFLNSGNCQVDKVKVKKLSLGWNTKQLPVPKEKIFDLNDWMDLKQTDKDFLMLVHTLRLRQMKKPWIAQKFELLELPTETSFKGEGPPKISTSLVSQFRPYPVAGSFIGLSLRPKSLSDIVATGVKDLNSNAHATYEEMEMAGRKANFLTFNKTYSWDKFSEDKGFEKLHPKLVSRLTFGDWNEIVFKSPLLIDAYIVYDLKDPNIMDARISTLNPIDWSRFQEGFEDVFDVISNGCRTLNKKVKYIKVWKSN